MLRVHTNATIEAGVFGIGAAGLVHPFPARTIAHRCGLHRHRHKTQRSTVHHCGRIPHRYIAVAAAPSGTVGCYALIDANLKNTNLKERLQLWNKMNDKNSQEDN